jgi:hypothetical protein
MDAEAERELDLAEREMGGYGVEEERERLRLKQQAREAKLARKEGLATEDEDGEPAEGSLTLDEYIMPTVQNLINALGGWEVRLPKEHDPSAGVEVERAGSLRAAEANSD